MWGKRQSRSICYRLKMLCYLFLEFGVENNVSNYFPNVLAVQEISRNLTKKGSNFQQTLKTFLVLSFIEYALDVILCGTALNLCLQFQMVETGNRDFLEYNIYLTRGWGPNMVSKVQAGCCIARYKFLIALTSSNPQLLCNIIWNLSLGSHHCSTRGWGDGHHHWM